MGFFSVFHSEMHKPEEERTWKFQCDVCQKRFRFRTNLDYHMHSHTGSRDHVCLTCGMTFKSKSVLNKHYMVHSEDRPYVCQHCNKSFKLQKYLSVHMLSHCMEKVLCRACGKLFPSCESLSKHRCRAVLATSTTLPVTDSVPQSTVTGEEDLMQQTHLVIEPSGDGDATRTSTGQK